MQVKLKFAKCHPDAKIPTQSFGDVGFDLRSVTRVKLDPGKTTVIHVGVKVADAIMYEGGQIVVPFLKVEGRSSLASQGIFPVGGIIDPSYRGEIGAIMFNSTAEPYVFEKGDKVAQLVCYLTFANDGEVKVIAEEAEVVGTSRGEKGFGSTGR